MTKRVSRRGRRLHNPVWNHYKPLDDCIASCIYCEHHLSYKTTTANLRTHMRKQHPHIHVSPNARSFSCTDWKQESVTDDKNQESIEDRSSDEDKPEDIDALEDVKHEMRHEDDSDTRPDDDNDTHDDDNSSDTCRDDNSDTRHSHGGDTRYKRDRNKRHVKDRRKIKRRDRGKPHEQESSAVWEASVDRFGLYIASLLKMIPRETAARYQAQIVERLLKENSH